LEKHLRSFAALTMGMVITIFYGEHPRHKQFDLEVWLTVLPLFCSAPLTKFMFSFSQVVELHDKSGKVLRRGEGVCIIDSDISCDFDEGRQVQPAAAVVAPSPFESRFALSAYELKKAAVSDDEDTDQAQLSAACAFVGTGKRIKAASTSGSAVAEAAASFGGGAAADSMGQSAPNNRPALSWCLNFHWYDGQQDKVPPNPSDVQEAVSRVGSASSRSSSSAVSRTSSASSIASDASSRAKTAGDVDANPFTGAPNKTKQKKP
jgi:hypothetical protein